MRMLSLYSGIGGIDLAAEWAGISPVAFCELDEFCQSILRRHWPHIPIIEKDTHVTLENPIIAEARLQGGIDIIAGGPPCQPFSVAGKRGGAADPRHRWPEMARIIGELRPAFVFIENVSGFRKMAERVVQADLEALGYVSRGLQLPSCAVGAPHQRIRTFVLAYSSDHRREQHGEAYDGNGSDAHRNESGGRDPAGRREERSGAGAAEAGRSAAVADSDRAIRIEPEPDEGSSSAAIARDARDRGSSSGESRESRSSPAMGDTDRPRLERHAGDDGRTQRRPIETRYSASPSLRRVGSESVEHSSSARREGRQDSGADQHDARENGSRSPESLRGCSGEAESRLGGMPDGISDRMDRARWPAPRGCEQFDWEPPRVTDRTDLRRKRLKAIGNSAMPMHVYPILAIMKAIWEEKKCDI